MHVRREMAAEQLGLARKFLAGWERRLKNPPDIAITCDGVGNQIEVAPVEEGAMVLQTLGEEDTIKLRAELAAIAASLEGLAGT